MEVVTRVLSAIFSPIVAVFQYLLFSFAQRLFFGFLSKAKDWGRIEINMKGEKETRVFGDLKSKQIAKLEVHRPQEFIWRCVTQADIGLAEGYMAGDFECDDMTVLLKTFIANREHMNGLDTATAWLSHIMDRLSHLRRANSIENSKSNIEDHYDLGNEMFQLFLDPSMTYSCAVFKSPEETLEEAQMNKLRMMIQKAELKKDDHLLEIGSGWASLSMEAVRMTGCRVTTITLSSQQKELAEQRIRERGMQDRIDVQLIDYRDIKGQYDKIISIEMLEAVGHEFLPQYFECCYKLLKPGGRMVFQVITFPHKNYESYRKGCDFIQKHIFPGGICPSLNACVDAVEEATKFVVLDCENIGYDYARTLREWRNNFLLNRHKMLKLGYDDTFIRKWEYYFYYCEAGFSSDYLGVYQVTMRTPKYLLE